MMKDVMLLSMPSDSHHFATTQWSVVLAAGHGSTVASHTALEELCSNYWYPLYAFVRRKGYGVDEAQDLTQEFFARFLEKNYLENVSPGKGRFRAYLLAALNHFLANEWDHRTALKRGRGKTPASLDLQTAENRYKLEPRELLTPERVYERRWALIVLERVLMQVRNEFADNSKEPLFDALKFCLEGETSAEAYASAAAVTGMTDGALKTAVHRLKRRYRDLLKREIAQTVGGESDVEDELCCLFSALSQA